MVILNIAFYQFRELSDLPAIKKDLLAFCINLGIKGSILISTEGLNGAVGGQVDAIRALQQYFENKLGWTGLPYKESYSVGIPFHKMFIKIKKEIIPAGDPAIRPAEKTAIHLKPTELKAWLDAGKDLTLLDTRNIYEIELGTFNNAIHFETVHFRTFFKKEADLEKLDREKPLVMFCTGGIRCEKASVMALNKGFKEVYQLEGGILKYLEECGDAHYSGSCYVFDDRLAVDAQLRPLSDEADLTSEN